MTFRGDQVPAPVEFLGAEEALGLKDRTTEPTAKRVLLGPIGQPGLELLLFLDR